jgi:hypothetical protein
VPGPEEIGAEARPHPPPAGDGPADDIVDSDQHRRYAQEDQRRLPGRETRPLPPEDVSGQQTDREGLQEGDLGSTFRGSNHEI